jgi:hypothetical protein
MQNEIESKSEFDLLKTLQMRASLPLMYTFLVFKSTNDGMFTELYMKSMKFQTNRCTIVPFYKPISL